MCIVKSRVAAQKIASRAVYVHKMRKAFHPPCIRFLCRFCIHFGLVSLILLDTAQPSLTTLLFFLASEKVPNFETVLWREYIQTLLNREKKVVLELNIERAVGVGIAPHLWTEGVGWWTTVIFSVDWWLWNRSVCFNMDVICLSSRCKRQWIHVQGTMVRSTEFNHAHS